MFNQDANTLLIAAETAIAQPIAQAKTKAQDKPPNGSGIVPAASWYCTFKYF